MNTTHTPGPWESTDEPKSWPIIRDAAGRNIAKTDCSISVGEWIEDTEQAVANARLIAAAPDLLDALNHLLSLMADEDENGAQGSDLWSGTMGYEKARAAVSKAIGQNDERTHGARKGVMEKKLKSLCTVVVTRLVRPWLIGGLGHGTCSVMESRGISGGSVANHTENAAGDKIEPLQNFGSRVNAITVPVLWLGPMEENGLSATPAR